MPIRSGPLGAALVTSALVACSGGSPDDPRGKSDDDIAPFCQEKIDAEVLRQAQEIADEPDVVGRRVLYGGEFAFGDLAVVRTSDETDASDYVALVSRLQDDVVTEGVCELRFVTMIGDATLPDLDDLDARLPAAACLARVDRAVLEQAIAVDETAEIVAHAPLYGGADSIDHVLIVRVSDEVEPSDYAVVLRSRDCKVEHVELLNSGLLPDVPGLQNDPCQTAAVDDDGFCRADNGQFAPIHCCLEDAACASAAPDGEGVCRTDDGRFAPTVCCAALCDNAALDADGVCRDDEGQFALGACCNDECVERVDAPSCTGASSTDPGVAG
jgi:hypothetical protein